MASVNDQLLQNRNPPANEADESTDEPAELESNIIMAQRGENANEGGGYNAVSPAEAKRTAINEQEEKKGPVFKKEETKEEKDEKVEVIKESTSGELDLQTLKKSWPEVLKTVKTKKINIYALVTECQVSSVKHDRITLVFKEGFEFLKEALNSTQNKEFLEKIISEFFGKKIELLVIMKDCELPEDLEGAKPQIDQDKAIKEALDFFGEDIVEIK